MGEAVGGAPGDAGSAAGGLRSTERSGEGVERPKGGLALNGERGGEEMGDGVLCSLWFSWCRTVTVIIETVGVVLFSHWCWEDCLTVLEVLRCLWYGGLVTGETMGNLWLYRQWRTRGHRNGGGLMTIQAVEDS